MQAQLWLKNWFIRKMCNGQVVRLDTWQHKTDWTHDKTRPKQDLYYINLWKRTSFITWFYRTLHSDWLISSLTSENLDVAFFVYRHSIVLLKNETLQALYRISAHNCFEFLLIHLVYTKNRRYFRVLTSCLVNNSLILCFWSVFKPWNYFVYDPGTQCRITIRPTSIFYISSLIYHF